MITKKEASESIGCLPFIWFQVSGLQKFLKLET